MTVFTTVTLVQSKSHTSLRSTNTLSSPYKPTSCNTSPCVRFPHQNSVRVSLFPSRPPSFHRRNSVWRRTQIMNLINVPVKSLSIYVKYFYQESCKREETGLPELPIVWSHTLFSGSGPVGLPPVPWTEKRNYFFFLGGGLQKLEQGAKNGIELSGECVE